MLPRHRPPPQPLAFLYLLLSFLFVTSTKAHENILHAASGVKTTFHSHPASIPFTKVDWSIYHRTSTILDELKRFGSNGGALCKAAEIEVGFVKDGLNKESEGSDGDTDKDEGMMYLKICPRGKNGGGVGNGRDGDRTRIMGAFGYAGRELISSEIAYAFVQSICGSDDEEEGERFDGSDRNVTQVLSDDVRRLIRKEFMKLGENSIEFVIVPVVNRDGRTLTEKGRSCDYANINDVDLENNWGYCLDGIGGGYEELGNRDGKSMENLMSDSSGSSNRIGNSGAGPFSEIETRSLKHIIEDIKPDAFISVRSGGLRMIHPYGCDRGSLQRSTSKRLVQILQRISQKHCPHCKVGNGESVKQLAQRGTDIDYIFEQMNVPFVYRWEVYADKNAGRGDCFRFFNPTSKGGYEETIKKWILGMMEAGKGVERWNRLEKLGGREYAEEDANNAIREAERDSERNELDEGEEKTKTHSKLHKLKKKAKEIQLWPRKNQNNSPKSEKGFGKEDVFVCLGLFTGFAALFVVFTLLKNSKTLNSRIKRNYFNPEESLKWA